MEPQVKVKVIGALSSVTVVGADGKKVVKTAASGAFEFPAGRARELVRDGVLEVVGETPPPAPSEPTVDLGEGTAAAPAAADLRRGKKAK